MINGFLLSSYHPTLSEILQLPCEEREVQPTQPYCLWAQTSLNKRVTSSLSLSVSHICAVPVAAGHCRKWQFSGEIVPLEAPWIWGENCGLLSHSASLMFTSDYMHLHRNLHNMHTLWSPQLLLPQTHRPLWPWSDSACWHIDPHENMHIE